MAMRDYICCSECDDKLIYDGSDYIRESLESKFGDEKAKYWTVKLVCPACLEQLRATVTEQAATIERLSSLADKWNIQCDEMREDNKRLDSVCQEQAARIKVLEDALEKFKDELFAMLIQDMSRDSAVKKINELIGE